MYSPPPMQNAEAENIKKFLVTHFRELASRNHLFSGANL